MKSQQWMVRLAVVVVGVGAARAQAPVSGGLTGRVTDDGGRGLPGVVVTALATVAGPIAPPPPTVVSGANGAFSFSGLAVGPYRLCLRAQAAYLLDPCEWGGKGVPAAAIPSGANAAANTVKLARGHLVHVQFADPGGLLTARTGQGANANHVLVGVWQSNGLFAPARLVSADNGGAVYQSFVPYDTALQLVVASKSVGFSQSGAALVGEGLDAQGGWGAPVRVAAGTAPPVVRVFRVEGVK